MSNETALQVIESAAKNGALVCFDKNNGFPQVELYRVEITEIAINAKTDCYCISKKYMPKKETVIRIGEAAGVIFTSGETKVIEINDPVCGGKHPVYVGIAQGKVRMADGTWRMSSICEYEFDPMLRAMLDYDADELNAQTLNKKKTWKNDDGTTKDYGDTLAVAIKEYRKSARARANTGAMLRVIRELVGMPIALTAEQVAKPVLFGRIVQNTNYILQTPEGRAMATAQALGVDMATLFGPKKPALPSVATVGEPAGIEPEDREGLEPEGGGNTANLANQAAASNEPDFPDEPTGPGSQQEENMFREKSLAIEQLMASYKDTLDVLAKNGKNPYKMAQDELANPNATIESRDSMIARLHTWLDSKGVKV